MVRLTVVALVHAPENHKYFNSTMVRLTEAGRCRYPWRNLHISIPLWFDWQLKHNSVVNAPNVISIPLWFDWPHAGVCQISRDFNCSLPQQPSTTKQLAIPQGIFCQQKILKLVSIVSCKDSFYLLAPCGIPLWFDWSRFRFSKQKGVYNRSLTFYLETFLPRKSLSGNSTMVRLRPQSWRNRNKRL